MYSNRSEEELPEPKKKPTDNSDLANIISARAALLDFYSDRATSFVSLFLASIFGLVTISAIVQSMLFNMLGEATIISQYSPFKLSINISFIILSILLFVIFVAVALYTYSRYTLFSDLSDKLTRWEMRDSAKLGSLFLGFKKKGWDEKKMKILERATKMYAEELGEDNKSEAIVEEKGDRLKMNFAIYEKYVAELQKKKLVKRMLDSKYFPLLASLLFLGLAVLTYYPLINFLIP